MLLAMISSMTWPGEGGSTTSCMTWPGESGTISRITLPGEGWEGALVLLYLQTLQGWTRQVRHIIRSSSGMAHHPLTRQWWGMPPVHGAQLRHQLGPWSTCYRIS